MTSPETNTTIKERANGFFSPKRLKQHFAIPKTFNQFWESAWPPLVFSIIAGTVVTIAPLLR
jgi:hypothetical protein